MTDHAPRLLARFTVDGLNASLETAATGERLTRLLARTSRAHGVRLIEDVAGWIVATGTVTRAEPADLAAEQARLRDEVVPHWADRGVEERLVTSLPEISAVLQHNDVGPWNIITDETSFTVVDWESARRHGLPLWDLVYFLTEALAGVDRVVDADRDEYTVRLYRGALPSSATLFEWIRRGIQAAEIPPEAVGSIITLCCSGVLTATKPIDGPRGPDGSPARARGRANRVSLVARPRAGPGLEPLARLALAQAPELIRKAPDVGTAADRLQIDDGQIRTTGAQRCEEPAESIRRDRRGR